MFVGGVGGGGVFHNDNNHDDTDTGTTQNAAPLTRAAYMTTLG